MNALDPSTGRPLAPPASDPLVELPDPSRETLTDDQLISEMVARLQSTESGRQVAGLIGTSGVEVRLVTRSEFVARHGHSGASYDPINNVIEMVREKVVRRPIDSTITLAHELQHVADNPDGYRRGVARALPGIAAGLFTDPLLLRNPATGFVDRMADAKSIDTEVTAHRLAAEVAQELGVHPINERGLAPDGSVREPDDLREVIEGTPGYRIPLHERALLGSAAAGVVTIGPAVAAEWALKRSGRAVPAKALYGSAAAIGAGLVAHDLATHRGYWDEPADPAADAAAVNAALDRLAATEHGAAIAAAMRDNDIEIVVVGRNEFTGRFGGGTAAAFHRADATIYLPRTLLKRPDDLVVLLAHEGTHAMDQVEGRHAVPGLRSFLGSSARHGMQGLRTGENPISAAIDNDRAASIESEVNAYMAAALVGREIGEPFTSTYAGDIDGNLYPRDEVRQRLEASDHYAMPRAERLLVASLLTGLVTIPVAAGAGLVLTRLTGREMVLPSLLATTAAGAAVVAHDQAVNA